MSDRALELDDIQGNVLAGFNTDYQVLVGLTARDVARLPDAARWLAGLAPSVTVVSALRAQRAQIKLAGDPTTWLCVAVGFRLLRATQSDLRILDEAFNGGMLRRAPSILSDKTAAANWRVGGPQAPVDALLIVAGNHREAVEARVDDLVEAAGATGLEAPYRETAKRLDEREHFGFRDGISQPKVAGLDPDGILHPGHFVFGYPKVAGGEPFWPVVVDERRITDNGSLLVFRRLEQDVAAFRKFCADETARLVPSWPGLTSDHLAALLVGRWPSGAPVEAGQSSDPGAVTPANDFDFHDDPDAVSCPFGAHIRKVNPRNGPKDVVDIPRMLRRGIPFGVLFDQDPDAKDRGLAFLAFQTSIKGQFEFLTRNWMNSEINPARGNDLLVGRSDNSLSMKVRGPNGPVVVSTPATPWITPTGGAYLFAPSRSGLAKLATPSAPLGLWKAKQLWAIATDSIKTALFD